MFKLLLHYIDMVYLKILERLIGIIELDSQRIIIILMLI